MSTRIRGTRGTRAAAIDAVAHVNDDPCDEIFLEVERISSGAAAVAYGFHNGRLVPAGVMLAYGGGSATKTDFNCLPGNPPRLIQRAYELIGPTTSGWWQETNVTYGWHGPKLAQVSRRTFKRRGGVTISDLGIGHGCITGIGWMSGEPPPGFTFFVTVKQLSRYNREVWTPTQSATSTAVS